MKNEKDKSVVTKADDTLASDRSVSHNKSNGADSEARVATAARPEPRSVYIAPVTISYPSLNQEEREVVEKTYAMIEAGRVLLLLRMAPLGNVRIKKPAPGTKIVTDTGPMSTVPYALAARSFAVWLYGLYVVLSGVKASGATLTDYALKTNMNPELAIALDACPHVVLWSDVVRAVEFVESDTDPDLVTLEELRAIEQVVSTKDTGVASKLPTYIKLHSSLRAAISLAWGLSADGRMLSNLSANMGVSDGTD